MLNLKYLALVFILAILAGSALSQQFGETDTGDLNLLALNNSSTNSSLINSTSTNSTERENTTSVYLISSEGRELPSPGKEVLDLSGYARDRANKSLAGYTNVMYPITGSRGTTTSTSGGGGGGGGCGCG